MFFDVKHFDLHCMYERLIMFKSLLLYLLFLPFLCEITITGSFWKTFQQLGILVWRGSGYIPHSLCNCREALRTVHLCSLHWQKSTIWQNMSRTPGSSSLFSTIRNSDEEESPSSPWVVHIFRFEAMLTFSLHLFYKHRLTVLFCALREKEDLQRFRGWNWEGDF